jgi:OOP family OmpA-OmpF porin
MVSAQDDMNKWSVGLQVGGHDGQAPKRISDATRLYQINHYALNGRYMFNNRFGLMLDLGYDRMRFKKEDLTTNYIRYSIQGVVNIGDLLKFSGWTNRIGLLAHGGFGLSHMWQKDLLENTPFFGKSDDMVNFIFGLTPQVRLNNRLSLNADVSFIFHGRQDYSFDMTKRNNRNGIDGYFLNLSIGASYYIGKADKHADWTPTVYGGSSDMSAYEAKVRELEEKLKNQKAPEEAPDRDGDGVPDAYDACPDKAGPWGFSGCPDTDGDGIPDHIDQCPDVFGSWKYQGCPEISREVKEVLDRALKGVNFETGRAVLTKDSYAVLNEVVRIMKEDKTYKLKITGHTDNVGTVEHNMKLSKDRAQAVEDYLESQGLDPDRFIVIGFGPTRPVASNDTPEGRAKNRRVEFTIVF